MKLLSSLALVLLSLSFFAGCSEDTIIASNSTIEDVFPMAVGNKWTYKKTAFNGDGSVYGEYTIKITLDTTYTYRGFSGFFNAEGNEVFYYSGADLGSINIAKSTPKILIRYPMAVSESVVTNDTLFADGLRIKTILRLASDNTIVTVPAGTFSCLDYVETYLKEIDGKVDTGSVTHHYYSIGVGLIKQDADPYYQTVTPKKTIDELTEYTLK